MTYVLVALGSALGGVARHGLSVLIAQRLGAGFPWGTIFVNVTGSFLIGLVAALTDARQNTQGTREFLMIGVLGGYTTFSAFSLQTLALLREGRLLEATGNVAGSVVLCVAAVWLGFLAGSLIRSR